MADDTSAKYGKWVSIAILAVIGLPLILLIFSITFAGTTATDRNARFIPSPSVAETALRAGLERWKGGGAVGPVEGTSPVVQVIDSHRKPDQELRSYEILGEVPGSAPRCFAVKVQYSNPEQEERLRFVVIGIDPLWVFHQEDYDMICHWAHPMEEKKPPLPSKTE